MRKKEIMLIVVLLALGGFYVHFFTHWFEKREISINASLRPNRRTKPPSIMVAFTLNGDYKLTGLKVVPLDGNKFNPLAVPVWNLSSDSNSVATRAFRYGQPIRGMKSVLKDVHPDPLAAGTEYRMILSTRDASGYKDFKMPDLGQ
jgi:hypothetical protein